MRIFTALILAACLVPAAQAVDVNPQRRTIPDNFINPPGKRYSIFAGDPARVQRANEINLKDFSTQVQIEPASLSLSNPVNAQGQAVTGFKVTFKVQNNGKKKSYPLSFPDAQRYDLAVSGPDDSLVWLWSEDKIFTQEADSLFINAGESITYTETIPVESLKSKAKPGTYKVVVILSNYPELKDSKEITLTP
ncbi:MAG: BsuPI-related putative proteinase inhibitor [Candidatus Methylacidiphilales bacterium]|nr:BsuPI-related putative proteinase inhibitor [Candidatus Methylacidiphilales bacterium]